MNNRLNWDDLKVTLTVARSGSLSAAARELGVSHATIYRKVIDVEERLGTKLFDRTRTGYTPTLAGEAMLDGAHEMEAYVFEIERKLTGQELTPSGKVRITTTDSLLFGPLSEIVANLHQTLPQIQLEVVISNNLLRISRREADIAIRPSSINPEQLVGRTVGRIQQAIYGAHACFGDTAGQVDYADMPWIAADESMSYGLLDDWMEAEGLNAKVTQRYNTVLGMFSAARNGGGLCALPCYLAEGQKRLVRIGEYVPALTTDLWLLTHKDLQQTARIQAVLEHLSKELRAIFK